MQKILLTMTVTVLLAACGGGKHNVKDATGSGAASTGNTAAATSSGAETAGAGSGAADTSGAGAQGAAATAERIIYFDFDSSDLKPEYAAAITAHAHALGANGSIRVRLEGHTDERGSPEYNIGLGERRAQAVRRALMLQGATEAQITTVSYGEERPAVSGDTEAAWAKNRRVEIIYLN